MAEQARKIDAEELRADYAMNRGSRPAAPAGNPLYPDTADQFNINQYGVRNATIAYRQPANQNIDNKNGVVVAFAPRTKEKPPRSKKAPRSREQNSALVAANSNVREGTSRIPLVSRKKKKKRATGAAETALAVANHARGIFMGFWFSAIGFKVWLFVQLPLAVTSMLGLGVWYYVEYLRNGDNRTWWERVLGVTADVFATFSDAVFSIFGWDYDSLTLIFWVTWTPLLIFTIVVILIVVLGFKVSFCRPLFGRMAGLKWATLILCVVGYMTPGLNLFPWIFLYIWVVALYPR